MRVELDFNPNLWLTRGYVCIFFRLSLPLFSQYGLSRLWDSRARKPHRRAWPAAPATIARLPDLASRGSPATAGHSRYTHIPVLKPVQLIVNAPVCMALAK